jgi:exonuclease III
VGLGWSIMKPKILVWNVSGLNDKDKSLRIRRLLRDWRADIVCLSETKLEYISREEIFYLWGCQPVD